MKIGLINIDSKYPNLALMKISTWHKQNGDNVKFWNAFESFDKIYASKIFKDTPTPYLPKDAIKGGSGFDLQIQLPFEIEHIYPDYSLFNIDYAMGYYTRGCINNCPFCIVPKKEGPLHLHSELSEFWNGQSHLMLLDNALTDSNHCTDLFDYIIDQKIKLNLLQGFNIRTITSEIAQQISQIKLWHNKQWKISWDNIKEEKHILKGINILNKAGIKNYQIMCYVLVGYNSSFKEDLYRVNLLDKMGIDPFVMMYQPTPELRRFTKWCNRVQIRHSCSYEEFNKAKGGIKSGI